MRNPPSNGARNLPTKVADEYVPKLWKFIERGTSQEPSQPRDAGIVLFGNLVVVAEIGVVERRIRLEALLGVVTLENLGLVFSPFDRTLQPMRMLMC